ncbi:hypothetical protein, partial [Microbispora bryophytorum]|uniref:hypothetical protein n=1 Tax=Microbispora bryophytorum TaxID=1460882 RepID=UPI001ABFADE8
GAGQAGAGEGEAEDGGGEYLGGPGDFHVIIAPFMGGGAGRLIGRPVPCRAESWLTLLGGVPVAGTVVTVVTAGWSPPVRPAVQ